MTVCSYFLLMISHFCVFKLLLGASIREGAFIMLNMVLRYCFLHFSGNHKIDYLWIAFLYISDFRLESGSFLLIWCRCCVPIIYFCLICSMLECEMELAHFAFVGFSSLNSANPVLTCFQKYSILNICEHHVAFVNIGFINNIIWIWDMLHVSNMMTKCWSKVIKWCSGHL